jgi:N-glycosyltransferase
VRVLCSVTGTPSHAHEMIPLAGALTRAGHDVLVACVPQLVATFTEAGVAVTAALADQTMVWGDLVRSGEFCAPGGIANPDHDQLAKVMAGASLIEPSFDALRSIASEFAPDLFLRDGMELSACLVAEATGVPHISTPSAASNMIDPAGLAPLLNDRRIALGLPVQHDSLTIYRYGRIDSVPPRYSFTVHQLPTAIAYQQPETVGRFASLPALIAALDPDKPLVYASIGAALPMMMALRASGTEVLSLPTDPHAALRMMVQALSELDCVAIVATGGLSVDGVRIADHVHLVDWVPQTLLLQCIQLFVTPGGYNSIRETMRAGVPTVVTPLFSEHFHNAARVSELGLGLQVTSRQAADIATACREVLAAPAISARVRHAQRELLALPSVDEIVPQLEALADSRSTLV